MNEENSPLNEKSKVTLQTKHQAESVLDITSLPKQSDAASLDTSVIDEQWAEMTQDWQSQPFIKTDMTALIKQTKRRMLQAKALLAFDVIGTFLLTLAVLYGSFYGDWDVATLIYGGSASILSIIFVSFAAKIRLASWRLFAVEPENIISTAIVGCKASLQYIKLLKLSCYALIPMMNWYLYEIVTSKGKSLLIPLLIANGSILVMYLITHYYQVKREQELAQLNKMSSE